jgi:hypothetical protein
MLLCLRVRFTIAANRLINFFKGSITGQSINSGIYGNYELKIVFTVFGAVLVGLKRIALRLLYVVFLVLFGMLLANVAASGGYAEFFALLGPHEHVLPPALPITLTPLGGERYSQWPTEKIDGITYRAGEHTVKSEGQLANYKISIEGDSPPTGIKTVDLSNIEKDIFAADENFKIIIPNSSAAEAVSFGISVMGEFYVEKEINDVTDYKTVVYCIMWAWFFLSFVGGIFGAQTVGFIFGNNEDIMLNYFRTDPALYAKSRILTGLASDMILYLPYLLSGFALAGIPAGFIFVMLLMYAAFRLAGEAANLFMYRHIGNNLKNVV